MSFRVGLYVQTNFIYNCLHFFSIMYTTRRVCYLARARAMARVVLAQIEFTRARAKFCMCYGNYTYDCILA